MKRANHRETLDPYRAQIAAKVRELRRSRKWTQAELSQQLQMSQSRLSELEQGEGSFTAEQFLVLLKLFNVAPSDFVTEPGAQDLRLQNALARLGAFHLQESPDVLPSERLGDVHDVVREALVDGSPRIVTALAPVLVRSTEHLKLAKPYAQLDKLGLGRRLPWVIENTLRALELLRKEARSRSKEWARADRMAEVNLSLELVVIVAGDLFRDRPLDVLDATIRSERSLRETQRLASKISKEWGIVTSLQPEDFLQALKAARAPR